MALPRRVCISANACAFTPGFPLTSWNVLCVCCVCRVARIVVGTQSTEHVLYYWPIKARNVVSLLIAAEAKIPLVQTTPEWPAFKPHTIFGQLPHLSFGSLQISQVCSAGSTSLMRFCCYLLRVATGGGGGGVVARVCAVNAEDSTPFYVLCCHFYGAL